MVRFDVACELPMSRDDFWRIRACPSFLRFIVSDGMLKRVSCTPSVVGDDGWCERELSYIPAQVQCPAAVRAVVGDTAFGVTDCQRWNDDVEPYTQQFRIRPSFLRDLSETYGALSLEDIPKSDHAMSESKDAHNTQETSGSDAGCADELDADTDADGDDADSTSTASMPTGSEAASSSSDLSPHLYGERCLHIVRGEARVNVFTVGWFVERAIAQNLRSFYDEYPASVARFRAHLVKKFAGGDTSVPFSHVVDRLLEEEARLERAENKREDASAATADDVVGDEEILSSVADDKRPI